MRRILLAGLLAAGGALFQMDGASAQVRMDPGVGSASQNITQVAFRRGGGHRFGGGHAYGRSFRGGYHGGYYGGRGYGGGYGIGAGIAGLAAGALIGGAIASQDGYYATDPGYGYGYPAYAPAYGGGGDPTAYCESTYRSYDPSSGTYLGYDGLRHPCP